MKEEEEGRIRMGKSKEDRKRLGENEKREIGGKGRRIKERVRIERKGVQNRNGRLD